MSNRPRRRPRSRTTDRARAEENARLVASMSTPGCTCNPGYEIRHDAQGVIVVSLHDMSCPAGNNPTETYAVVRDPPDPDQWQK